MNNFSSIAVFFFLANSTDLKYSPTNETQRTQNNTSLNKYSKLSKETKVTIYITILNCLWTYGIELRGSAKKLNIRHPDVAVISSWDRCKFYSLCHHHHLPWVEALLALLHLPLSLHHSSSTIVYFSCNVLY